MFRTIYRSLSVLLSALPRIELTEKLWHSRITLYFKSSQAPFHKERL